jgi:transposase-like protein
MQKVSAKGQKSKQYEDYLREEGVLTFEQFQKCGMEYLLQEAVEGEVDQHLGRQWYEHTAKGEELRGYRNGYYDRQIRTAEGRYHIRHPRIRNGREPFVSRILSGFKRMHEGLKRLAVEMYVRGLSTRDIEQTLIDDRGKPILSRSVVSELNQRLYAEYERFRRQDLSRLDIAYLFVDGVYEAVRKFTNNQAMLCAWAILSNGSKQMLHIGAVQSESQQAWEDFFDDMLRRGLRQPLLVISDGNPGLVNAIARKFPHAYRQRCLVHKLRNIMAKLPREHQAEVLRNVKEVYHAASYKSAQLLAARFVETHAHAFPAAVQCFSDDLEACLVHLNFPAGHHKFIRSTNLLERAFEEEKRRTKVLPHHVHERGMMGLVFGVLHRASQRWHSVSMNAVELAQLRHIRHLICPLQPENQFISYQSAA